MKRLLDLLKRIKSSRREEYPDRRSPTLQTVLMIEKYIKENSGKYKKAQLRKNLPEKVRQPTFQFVLEYLESIHRIIYNNEKRIVYIKKRTTKL